MEIQIQDLVSSIKKEGIDEANKEANEIIENAKKKADEIIGKANQDAKSIKESAEKEIGILKESAKVSAEQAKRDAMLSFKEEVGKVYKKILSDDISKELDSDSLGKLISAVLKDEDVSKYEAQVKEVSDALKTQLKDEINSGLEIKVNKEVKSGFRLASKDGSGYIDCTEEAIEEMLMPYLRNLDF